MTSNTLAPRRHRQRVCRKWPVITSSSRETLLGIASVRRTSSGR